MEEYVRLWSCVRRLCEDARRLLEEGSASSIVLCGAKVIAAYALIVASEALKRGYSVDSRSVVELCEASDYASVRDAALKAVSQWREGFLRVRDLLEDYESARLDASLCSRLIDKVCKSV